MLEDLGPAVRGSDGLSQRVNTRCGFLTCDANDVVGAVHPKAMPVILTTEVEIEQWMTAPAEEALDQAT
jgi:putative SOS response-associated peptidase YedK